MLSWFLMFVFLMWEILDTPRIFQRHPISMLVAWFLVFLSASGFQNCVPVTQRWLDSCAAAQTWSASSTWPWVRFDNLVSLKNERSRLELRWRLHNAMSMNGVWLACQDLHCVSLKRHPFSFVHNSVKWWSICTTFLPDVAKEILI